MIERKDILADLHTHTIFSKHAYSTVEENIRAAREQGLKFLAITDHYFNDGTELERKNEVNRIKYLEQRVNPHEKDIFIVGSAEFNLGHEVYQPKKLESLSWKPIGLHNWFFNVENATDKDIYYEFAKAADKGFNAFVHIERELYKLQKGKYNYSALNIYDLLEFIVDLAYDKDIFLEVNESSLITNEEGGAERMEYWLRKAKEKGCKIYLGTDAHYSGEIGKFDNAIEMLNKVDYPKNLILNCTFAWMKELFDR